MPYKANTEVITPWIETLDKILDNAKRNEVTILETDFPKEVRWYLLQALHAARKLSVEPYCNLSVKIRRRGLRALVVYPKLAVGELSVKIHTAPADFRAVPKHGVSSLLALVSTVMNSKDPLLSFPDLDPSLLEAVKAWAKNIGHTMISEDPVTIQKGTINVNP
jgi:hypothetical protein